MIILGIAGRKRVGKNTLAKYISLLAKCTVREFAFADDLKNEVANLCKVSRKEIDTDKELYRPLLQAWGTYQKKIKGDDYWTAKVFRRILRIDCDVAIITDCRFPHECEDIRAAGGRVVSICRDTGLVDSHESENALKGYTKFDEIIINTGDLNHLLEQTKELMRKLKIEMK
jgi:hypothetical protein